MEGRLRIEGTGNSVHAISADANGTLSAVISEAQMRKAFAELAGIDVVRGLGPLLTDKQQMCRFVAAWQSSRSRMAMPRHSTSSWIRLM